MFNALRGERYWANEADGIDGGKQAKNTPSAKAAFLAMSIGALAGAACDTQSGKRHNDSDALVQPYTGSPALESGALEFGQTNNIGIENAKTLPFLETGDRVNDVTINGVLYMTIFRGEGFNKMLYSLRLGENQAEIEGVLATAAFEDFSPVAVEGNYPTWGISFSSNGITCRFDTEGYGMREGNVKVNPNGALSIEELTEWPHGRLSDSSFADGVMVNGETKDIFFKSALGQIGIYDQQTDEDYRDTIVPPLSGQCHSPDAMDGEIVHAQWDGSKCKIVFAGSVNNAATNNVTEATITFDPATEVGGFPIGQWGPSGLSKYRARYMRTPDGAYTYIYLTMNFPGIGEQTLIGTLVEEAAPDPYCGDGSINGPTEICDDGTAANTGLPGACAPDCSGIVPTGNPDADPDADAGSTDTTDTSSPDTVTPPPEDVAFTGHNVSHDGSGYIIELLFEKAPAGSVETRIFMYNVDLGQWIEQNIEGLTTESTSARIKNLAEGTYQFLIDQVGVDGSSSPGTQTTIETGDLVAPNGIDSSSITYQASVDGAAYDLNFSWTLPQGESNNDVVKQLVTLHKIGAQVEILIEEKQLGPNETAISFQNLEPGTYEIVIQLSDEVPYPSPIAKKQFTLAEIPVDPFCGDGIVQPQNGELCDEGVDLNGTQGHCDLDCQDIIPVVQIENACQQLIAMGYLKAVSVENGGKCEISGCNDELQAIVEGVAGNCAVEVKNTDGDVATLTIGENGKFRLTWPGQNGNENSLRIKGEHLAGQFTISEDIDAPEGPIEIVYYDQNLGTYVSLTTVGTVLEGKRIFDPQRPTVVAEHKVLEGEVKMVVYGLNPDGSQNKNDILATIYFSPTDGTVPVDPSQFSPSPFVEFDPFPDTIGGDIHADTGSDTVEDHKKKSEGCSGSETPSTATLIFAALAALDMWRRRKKTA